MDATDEPTTTTLMYLAIAGLTVGTLAATGVIGPKPGNPKVSAGETQPKVTAPQEEQLSETARRNRRRKASMLTSGFTPPKLGMPGLLGESE